MADDEPAAERQSGRVTVLLPAYLHDWLRGRARELALPKSSYVRTLIVHARRDDLARRDDTEERPS